MEYKGKHIVRTIIQALELLQLVKGTSQDAVASNNSKPVAIAIIEFCLSEGIIVGPSIHQAAENSIKFF